MRTFVQLGGVIIGCLLASLACSGGGASAEDSGGAGSGSGGGPVVPGVGSAGCGRAITDASKQWLEKTTTADGTPRTYLVFLPDGYDPAHPYPVVYQFHGCSDQREANNVPVENSSGDLAIHVRGRAVGTCWDDASDLAFFDAMVSDIEANYCADTKRRFATGYSSGSFIAQRLACERADVLRAVATIAGGNAGGGCSGRIASLQIHDQNDPTVGFAGGEALRDQLAERDGCDATRSAAEPAPCEAYQGCDEGYPVVWCATTGQGHDRQDGLAAPAFWNFLAQF